MKNTVFSMIHEVLSDAREKIAANSSARDPRETVEKTASRRVAPPPEEDVLAHAEKVAEACDYLAENMHRVADSRSPQEKLAEYTAIQNALLKEAFELGGKGDSGLTAGVGPGGPQSAMSTMAAATPGGPILHGGDSGQATESHQPPKTTSATEKPFPASAPNALQTNLEDQPGGSAPYPEKMASLQKKARHLAALVGSGQIRKEAAAVLIKQAMSPVMQRALIGAGVGGVAGGALASRRDHEAWERNDAENEQIAEQMAMQQKQAMKLAAASGAPKGLASALLKKFAEDALNPAQISAGTTPELQDVPGTNSAQMQGSEAGQLTPDTLGDTGGRNLIASNEAAINATKKDAKHSKTQAGVSSLLNEPAMSAAHDNVLNKSLDNTSSAGVKIAAANARAMLKKWASQSSANTQKLASFLKHAGEGMPDPMTGAQPPVAGVPGMPPQAGMPPMSPGGAAAPMPGAGAEMTGLEGEAEEEAPPVSDEAMMAASEGVTPEELAVAHNLLAGAEGTELEAAASPAVPPTGGEKTPPVAEGSA